MSSQQDDAVFCDIDEDDDDEDEDDDDLINENDDVLPEEEEDDDEDEELDLEVEDHHHHHHRRHLNLNSNSTSVAVTVASVPDGSGNKQSILPDPIPSDPKRPRIPPLETIILPQADKKPQPMDETRRLFQRLWTDEDEIELLQGFLDYTAQRGPAHHDTALFYGQIKSKLQLDFNKNQLVEKLRRLKKKYRNVISKITSGKDFSFKSHHDQATFEISRKIWSSSTGGNLDDDDATTEVKPLDYQQQKSISAPAASRKRSRPQSRSKSLTGIGGGGGTILLGPTTPTTIAAPIGVRVEENCNTNNDNNNSNNNNNNNNNNKASSGSGNINNNSNSTNNNNNDNNNNHNVVGAGSNLNVSGLIEETVRSCLSPLFKELLSGMVGMGAGPFGGLVANSVVPLGFGGGGGDLMMVADERWRKQQILELEVYSKRLELVQDQIRAQLEELRSAGGASS